ncbi:MAG: HAD-IIB family hydrolase [Pseudomonadota bacterium]
MRPLAEMPTEAAAAIRAVFADIDDTITTDGRLPAAAYDALERLKTAGFAVVPVTGRPAGWCDMIARFWPVDGVVGENGAFYFAYDRAARTMRAEHAQGAEERAAAKAGLARIEARCLAEVPGCAVAADQPYRLADLAIDFCEDVAPLGEADIARIKAIFEEEGATAKVSSIHVNGWYGDYDKLTMSRRLAADRLGLDLDADRAAVVYCGDSPNDAPMFAHFPNACGVANVADFAGRIDAEPAWIAPSRGAAGFVEIAERLLAARGAVNELRNAG